MENQSRLPIRWLGERPPVRISSNAKEGTGNIKLEVYSWSIAKKLVTDSILIKGKKCNVDLWGYNPKANRQGTSNFLKPPNPGPRNTRNPPSTPSPQRDFRCYNCGKTGHIQYHCPELKLDQCDRCGSRGHNPQEYKQEQRRMTYGRRSGKAPQNVPTGPRRGPPAWKRNPQQPPQQQNQPQAQKSAPVNIVTMEPPAGPRIEDITEATTSTKQSGWGAEHTQVKW